MECTIVPLNQQKKKHEGAVLFVHGSIYTPRDTSWIFITEIRSEPAGAQMSFNWAVGSSHVQACAEGCCGPTLRS